MSRKQKHYYRISRKPLVEQYKEASPEPRKDSPRYHLLKEIASIVNVSPKSVHRWMKGERSPGVLHRRMLAIYYRTPECMLFKGMKPPTTTE